MNAKKPFRKPGISQRKLGKIHGSSLAISCIWLFNGIIVLTLAFISGGEFLKGSFLEYSKVQHDPYDGALSPISYIPNYSREDLRKDKYRRYENFELSDFIELPKYQTEHLSQTGSDTILDRFTYIIPYMGSYRMNGLEYDGSHAGVDIRAPLGTPVLAIGNGVVVQTSTNETGIGKYIVIRHDGVLFQGRIGTYYSSYLHLEDVQVQPGMSVKKGKIIGKVGLTGITTTPHLHFQVDTQDSLFHPFWPFTVAEAKKFGADFFSAVNQGIGKEKALLLTVHPIEFVSESVNSVTTTAPVIQIAASSSIKETPLETTKDSVDIIFGMGEGEPLTRALALKSLFDQSNISYPEYGFTPFSDVFPSEPYSGVIEKAVEMGVVKSRGMYYPESPITRGEFIQYLSRLSNYTSINNGHQVIFQDTESMTESLRSAVASISEQWDLKISGNFSSQKTVDLFALPQILQKRSNYLY